METSAAPGNRLGKILARNQMGQKGGTSRPEESARGPGYEQASINPNDIGMGAGNYREARAGTGEHKRHEHDNSLTVVIVCHMTGGERKEEPRHPFGATHPTHSPCPVGLLLKIPA